MSRVAIGLLLCLGGTTLYAQEPPAHLPMCVTDEGARHLEAQVRYLLSATDSAGRARLAEQSLAPAPADSVQLVSEEQVCTLSSIAYAGSARAARGMTGPFPVSVVRAPGRLLVQLGGRAEVVVLDEAFRSLGSIAFGQPEHPSRPSS
ncbi:MAG: hypothetical protein E4H38_06160 [Gemmatimonadales bacterium]|nr:MAG: hypothetical protein E4H38_06160 [Gemmatimonadales bacterium]